MTQFRSAPPSYPDRLRDFSTDHRLLLLLAMAPLVGTVGALAAWALSHLIALATHLSYGGHWSFATQTMVNEPHRPVEILIPVLGCFVIGLMARFGSEKIRGHGIPEAMEAILIGKSRISPKVALLKPLSSAISIGTGGPFGAEGPIIMTGGAFGSIFAQFFHLTNGERKTMLVAGASAGMAATFGTPVAAMLLAVELLLFEWKPRSFVPVAVAAVVAAAWRPWLLGADVLFPMAISAALPPLGLLLAGGLGIVAGLASGLLTQMVYRCEDWFHGLPIHWMWWPMLGGLVVGVGGLIEPRALGVGYDNIAALLQGGASGSDTLRLMVVKAVIWSVALGSGTSGGVLAPLLIMGGALGALFGGVMPIGEPGLWALIGMAAMMGGTMRSPLTAMIFAIELTHNFGALLPLAIGCTMAHATTVLLLRRSILTEKVARRGHHVLREYSVDPFVTLRVAEIMTPIDGVAAAEMEPLTGSVAKTSVIVGYDDELVGDLADRMALADLARVTVLSRDEGLPVGIVGDQELRQARARHVRHELRREQLIRLSPVPGEGRRASNRP